MRAHGSVRSSRLLASLFVLVGWTDIAEAADKLTFSNDWFPAGDKGVQYYAQQKGFFAAEGLDVSFMTSKGSSESITRVASGVADVGSGSLVALLQAKVQSKVPVKAVISIYNTQPDAILTTDDSSLKSLKDLEGKKIATATFAASNVFWPLILKTLSLDENKIALLKANPTALTPLLAAGQVDGIISWMTSSVADSQTLAQVNKKLKILLWSEVGFEGYSYSTLVSEKLLNERPDVARRFTRAMLAAGKAALSDPKGVARAVKTLYPETDELLAEKDYVNALPLMDNAITKAEGFGVINRARLQKTWEWTARAQGYSFSQFDPEDAVARSVMPQ